MNNKEDLLILEVQLEISPFEPGTYPHLCRWVWRWSGILAQTRLKIVA